MNRRRPRTKRARHGTRNRILEAIKSDGGARPLRTAEIRKKVAQLSGKRIPDYSLYQALRTLVRKKVLQARRVGREFSYQLVSDKQVARAPKVPRRQRATGRQPAKPSAEPGSPLHKLAPGEIVILVIGTAHVETATNRRGRLVLERHPRPA